MNHSFEKVTDLNSIEATESIHFVREQRQVKEEDRYGSDA